MPILPPEPNFYPDNLFVGFESAVVCPTADLEPPPSGYVWWVLHTLPRQEKSLARQLLDGRTPFYLPLTAHRGVVRGRVIESQLPLFPGYVFLLGGPERRLAALATKRVVRAISVPDGAALWRDLRQLNHLITSGLPVRPEEKLGPGSPVDIRSGPLAGLRGVVVRAASGRRFVVSVDFIGRGASVLLDDYMLIPAEKVAV
jgi:transcription antitermination factor NusG